MAVAAIDTVIADVMLVAEGDRLFYRCADRYRRPCGDPPGEDHGHNEQHHGQEAELQHQDEIPLKYLRHSFFLCLPYRHKATGLGSSRAMRLSCARRGHR